MNISAGSKASQKTLELLKLCMGRLEVLQSEQCCMSTAWPSVPPVAERTRGVTCEYFVHTFMVARDGQMFWRQLR